MKRSLPMAVVVLLFVAVNSGCVSFLSSLSYWSGASLVQPDYSGFRGKRVAVVCVSDSSSYGTGGEAALLARMVSSMLQENVPDIEVVPASEIADWDDKNDWDEIDYREVGQGVKADRVLAIDLSGFSLHQGQSLYKGRADVTLSVLDMNRGGQEVFRRHLADVTYPVNGFYHTTETPENTFRRVFLHVLARRVARHFFEYDPLDEFGPDPAGIDRL